MQNTTIIGRPFDEETCGTQASCQKRGHKVICIRGLLLPLFGKERKFRLNVCVELDF